MSTGSIVVWQSLWATYFSYYLPDKHQNYSRPCLSSGHWLGTVLSEKARPLSSSSSCKVRQGSSVTSGRPSSCQV